MHEFTCAIRESLMHYNANQLSVAVCAGDGTCASHMLCSIASACQLRFVRSLVLNGLALVLNILGWLGAIATAPACAYVAGVPAAGYVCRVSWDGLTTEFTLDPPATAASWL